MKEVMTLILNDYTKDDRWWVKQIIKEKNLKKSYKNWNTNKTFKL